MKSGVVGLQLNGGGDNSYYFIIFAFAAGFSERLAQDMLLGSTLEAVSRGKRRREPDEQPPEEATLQTGS